MNTRVDMHGQDRAWGGLDMNTCVRVRRAWTGASGGLHMNTHVHMHKGCLGRGLGRLAYEHACCVHMDRRGLGRLAYEHAR
jgi:hypothetical protein